VTSQEKRIGIFVIAYNAVNKLDWTLDRIPQEVWDKVEEVFLFDDCSTDNTFYAAIGYKHSKQVDKLTVHRNQQNLRYGGNQKAGYQYAIARGFDIVVMLHADGQYAPEVLNDLLKPLETGEADMVFGSRMAAGGDPRAGGMPLYKFMGNRILTWLENRITGMNLSEFHSGYRLYSCEALKKVPFLLNSDEWHFDTEILIQHYEAGLRIVERPIPTYYGDEISYVNGVPYAFNCIKTALGYRLHKEQIKYDARFDTTGDGNVYKKADPYSSDAQIIKWIEKERPAELLEVGTATGFVTSAAKKLGCEVTGIEVDAGMAEIARQYCRDMFVGDVETMDLSGLGGYDAIILGDILKYLHNPGAVLSKLSGLLKPGGQIVLSLPKVPNFLVRFSLVLDRLNYSRYRLLDETNPGFFTLKTAKQWAADSGFDVSSTGVTPVALPLTLPVSSQGGFIRLLNVLKRRLTKLSKMLLGYQSVLVCRQKA
jgi:glycosyltransferase involved in cell wall biosynthesis